MDDLELARILRDARDRSRPSPARSGSRAFMGRVTTTSPAVGKFMNVQPQSVLGAEVEGGAAIVTDLGSTPTPVYLLGPGVPATGDQVVARWSDWRWVARKRSGGGSIHCFGSNYVPTVLTLSCSCGTPATLTYNPSTGYWEGCGTITFPTLCAYPVTGYYIGSSFYCYGPFAGPAATAVKYKMTCTGYITAAWSGVNMTVTGGSETVNHVIAKSDCSDWSSADSTPHPYTTTPCSTYGWTEAASWFFSTGSFGGAPTYGPFYNAISGVSCFYHDDLNGSSSISCDFSVTE